MHMIESDIPKVSKKQIHQGNVPANSPEEYHERALVIPIVDTFISEMTHCSNKFSCKVAEFLILTPCAFIFKKIFHFVEIWSVFCLYLHNRLEFYD